MYETLFHSCLGVPGIYRTELLFSSSLRAEKKGGIPLWALRAWCGSLISQAKACLPTHRVLSSPEKSALLPLGSYSSYHLLSKMY